MTSKDDPAPPRLKPLTVVEILDRSFHLYRRNAFLFLALFAVIYLPFRAGAVAFQAAYPELFQDEDPRLQKRIEVIQQLAEIAVYGFVLSVSTGAMTRAVGDLILGRTASFRRSFAAVGRNAVTFLGSVALAEGACLLGFLACLVPGAILTIRYVFVSAVVLLEGTGGPPALTRSRKLTEGHRDRILGLFALSALINVILITAVTWAGEEALPLIFEDEWTRWYAWNAIEALTETLLAPVFVIAWVLLYYDVRIRKEAFDLEVLARSLASPDSPEGETARR